MVCVGWQDKVNALKVARELNEKTYYVDWFNKERKETLYIFAKSFSKRIDEIEGKPVELGEKIKFKVNGKDV